LAMGLRLDVLADVPTATVAGDLLDAEEDAHVFVVGADDDGLGDEGGRDGVEVPVEADAVHLRHGGALELVGLEAGRGERPAVLALPVLEGGRGPFAGALVPPPVGKIIPPARCLDVEVEQVGEAAAGPEALAHETDGAFDPALLVS